MNIWKILEIQATDDLSVIKSAYARKLKVCHPEDDPESFQSLRDAYNFALKLVKAKASNDETLKKQCDREAAEDLEDAGNSVDSTEQIAEEKFRQSDGRDSEAQLNDIFQTDVAAFMSRMQSLYDDFYARLEINNWSQLLQTDFLWKIRAKEILSPVVLRFLEEHPVLPQNIWNLMNTEFNWSDISIPPPEDCESALFILQKEIDPQWNLSFSKFHNDESIGGKPEDQKNVQTDFPLYANYRKNLRDAIIKENYDEAEGFYIKAVSIFENDPDIYRMYSDYLTRDMINGNVRLENDIHLEVVDKVIEFYPDNHYYLLRRADLYLDKGQYEAAISDYKKLLLIFPDNLEIPFHLVTAYNMIGKKGEKKRYYRQIRKKYPKIQKRLKLNRYHPTEGNATTELILANERVFVLCKKIPLTIPQRLILGLITVGLIFFLGLIVYFVHIISTF